ncbi:PseG/SpsG family protein [Nonomuraea sp. NPDC049309]|uniref:PseG/SpsG family protein n=1 Tax=Nonomuraea sp. NPDC049309 TaxID=3364350 RepID=UPI00372059D8
MALAEELVARGADVVFLGEVRDSPWARAQLDGRGLPLVPAPDEPAGLAALARELALDAVVLDSYALPRDTGATLRAAGLPVLAVIDGDPLGQEADLYLDQNLGAERRPFALPGRRLAGARYVLLRDSVRGRTRASREPGPPRVLCFFGGTDSAGVAPRWAAALNATGLPFTATVVSPVPFDAGPITVIPPTDRLPELMAAADLVVTAAGSAVWELLHLGVPTALTWVAANQLIGYEELTRLGAAAPLGPEPPANPAAAPINEPITAPTREPAAAPTREPAAVPAREPGPEAVAVLARLLADPAARAELGRRGSGLVDGKGRERVADALLALLPKR